MIRSLILLALLGCSSVEEVSSACQYSPGCMEAVRQEDIAICESQNRVWTGNRCRDKTRRERCEDSGGVWDVEMDMESRLDFNGNLTWELVPHRVCRN